MRYSELTRRHFESASRAGVLTGPGVARGEAGSRTQGTWVQFDVQIEQGIIRAVRFLAFACPHVIAVADWLAEHSVGRAADARLPESVQSLRERFEMPLEKLGRLLIVEDAWRAALTGVAGGAADGDGHGRPGRRPERGRLRRG